MPSHRRLPSLHVLTLFDPTPTAATRLRYAQVRALGGHSHSFPLTTFCPTPLTTPPTPGMLGEAILRGPGNEADTPLCGRSSTAASSREDALKARFRGRAFARWMELTAVGQQQTDPLRLESMGTRRVQQGTLRPWLAGAAVHQRRRGRRAWPAHPVAGAVRARLRPQGRGDCPARGGLRPAAAAIASRPAPGDRGGSGPAVLAGHPRLCHTALQPRPEGVGGVTDRPGPWREPAPRPSPGVAKPSSCSLPAGTSVRSATT